MNAKRNIIILMCLLALSEIHAQVPPLQWVQQTISTVSNRINAMTVDNDGNIIVAVSSTAPFEFAGIEIPHTTMLDGNPFVSTLIKIDPEGNVLWHRALHGPWQNSVTCGGLDTDADMNIYVSYRGQSNLENASTIGELYVSSPKSLDDFLVKISPDGQGLWFKVANRVNNTMSTYSPTLKLGPDGVIMTSYLTGSVNFDGMVLTAQGFYDAYVVKHDFDGNVQWGKAIVNTFGDVYVEAIEAGNDGGVYLGGDWSGDSLHIDHLSLGNDLAFTGNSDRWICKLDTEGTAEWLAREHSAGYDFFMTLELTDNNELLVVTDHQEGVLHIGEFEIDNPGVVLSRYSSDGEVLSASLVADSQTNTMFFPPFVSSIDNGAYLIAGTFDSETYTIGGIQVTNAAGTTGTLDIFMAKMDASNQAEWVYTIGSEESEWTVGINAVNQDQLIFSGSFNGFGLDLQGVNLFANTPFVPVAFLASFSTSLATRTSEALKHMLVYPNPFSENVQLDAAALQAFGNATLSVFDTKGVEVYRKQLQSNDAGQISLGHLPQGAYVARLSDGKRSLHTKIIKQ